MAATKSNQILDTPTSSQDPPKKTRKRNRVPISCVICRRRKVKCDKQKPQCLNCIKNNVQHLCHYLEPKWAQPTNSESSNLLELKSSFETNSNSIVKLENNIDNNIINSNNNPTTQLETELDLLKTKIKSLEFENIELKKRLTVSLANSNTTNQITNNINNQSNLNINNIRIKPQDTDDVLDSIYNSNILFIAQKNTQYNIPITYQISVFSWMFMVKNDLYLNDLWMKILKLRQHYEYYYNSKGTLEKNMISHYKNYDNKLSKFKNSDNMKTSYISQDKTNEHTSKLKKFLEKSLNLEKSIDNNINTSNNNTKNNNKNEIEIISSPSMTTKSSLKPSPPQLQNVCPVTGVVGVCPMGNSLNTFENNEQLKKSIDRGLTNHNLIDDNASLIPNNNDKKLIQRNNNNILKFNKCPVLNPNDSSILTSKKTDAEFDSDNDELLEDNKICPLMVGDTKALFKEKLSKMNISALRESYINRKKTAFPSPAKSKGTPIIPSSPNTPMSEIKSQDTEKLNNFVPIAIKPEPSLSSRQNSNKRKFNSNNDISLNTNKLKKLKSISPSAIKSINYNNMKQVITVIEQYLPSKKVVGLLLDRFFDKIYIYMPYIDESSFRHKVSVILKLSDSSAQKIKLTSIGTQYCEEFLIVCLLVIIIRLSWLTLPEKLIPGLNQNELLLIKPENFVSFVLVDLVKEIFSNSKIMSKPSIIIFQVGLFLKIYSTVSPEDGFDTDDSYTRNNSHNNNIHNVNQNDVNTPNSLSSSTVNDLPDDLTNESPNMNSPNFIAMLVQLAQTIGLNRDPLNFKNFHPNQNDNDIAISRLFKKRHLWRKLWYGLVFMSIEANLSLGDYLKGLPIEIELDPTLGSSVNRLWDCRLPGGIEQGVLENSFENGKALQKELCVVQIFRESINSYRWIYKGMKLLFDVDKPPTTPEIENVISKLSEIICEKSKFGYGIDLIMGDQEIVNPFRARNSSVWVKKYTKQIKVLRLKVHLIVKNMLFTLNYLLFLNHEQKLSKLLGQKNASIEKIEKQRQYIETFFEASLLSSIESFKLFVQFMDENDKVFPNCSTDLLIYPFLMILNHRSHEFLISLVLRVQQSSPVIMEILKKNKIDPKELQKRLFTYLETFIERLDILTKKYYYAWVLKRLVKFFYNILTNSQKLFKLNFKKMNVNVPQNIHNKSNGQKSNNLKTNKKNENISKTGEKSAFEIAYGTSKLPPVTDYTHDDRREINFNPATSNSEILMPAIISNNNLNVGNNLADSMFQNMENDLNFCNSGNISPSDNVINQMINYNRMSKFDSNGANNANHLNTRSAPRLSGGNIRNDRYNNTINEELTALFDDQFLNDIGSFALQSIENTGLLGLHRGLSSDTISPSPNLDILHNTELQNMNFNNIPNISRSNLQGNSANSVNIINNTGVNNYTNNNSSNLEMNSMFNSQMMNDITTMNNNRGELYNSLNEIDFTNVDFNTPLDNLAYGFDLNFASDNNVNNNNTKNYRTNANSGSTQGNDGQSLDTSGNTGLGSWNFF
jgi:heme activator protein 1